LNDTVAILGHYVRAKYGGRFRSRRDLERWQERRFERFAREVLLRSPYYREFVGAPLHAYPFSDKATMMEAFDRINTRGLRRDDLIALAMRAEASRDFSPTVGDVAVGLSSGTSGRRALFATSPSERRRYAGVVMAKGLRGSLFGAHRIALLLRANNPLYEAVNRSSRVRFGFFDLLLPFAQQLRALEAFDPHVLIGPPQVLRLVAGAVAEGRARLSPRQVVAGAEVLEAADAVSVEAAFGVRVDQIYQATEGFLGISCAHGMIHLNEDGMIVERQAVDASGRFMPVVTDLWRATQPIVRYRLDDVLVESRDPCPCGSVLTAVARIEGRADDILFLPSIDGRRLVPVMPDFVRDRLASADAVADYRVIQHAPDAIELLVDGHDAGAAARAACDALSSVFAAARVEAPAVSVGGRVPVDFARKRRRVERRFPADLRGDACAS
jgi:putative adenylate-forming enzyme